MRQNVGGDGFERRNGGKGERPRCCGRADAAEYNELLAASVQGSMANRPTSVLQHASARRLPRSSNSTVVVDSAAQRTWRKSAPVTVDRRLPTPNTAGAAAGRVGGAARPGHPGVEQTGARATSPAITTTHRPTTRPNRSSDIRMTRRDSTTASRPPGLFSISCGHYTVLYTG